MSGRAQSTSYSPPWGFRSFLTKAHDGDSFWMMTDTGFGARVEPELRLSRVSAPEIHPLQPGGQETLAFVNDWLSSVQMADPARRWPFWLEVEMTTTYEPSMDMSFTRYIATVYPYGLRNWADSLNAQVNTYLSGHPEWGTGD
jgi:hypothetical protein